MANQESDFFKSKITLYVLACWILAAFGGLMFGYDIGISGNVKLRPLANISSHMVDSRLFKDYEQFHESFSVIRVSFHAHIYICLFTLFIVDQVELVEWMIS